MPKLTPTIQRAILTRKVYQTDLVFVEPSAFISIGLCMQDYKCLCAAVTICAIVVDPKFDFPF